MRFREATAADATAAATLHAESWRAHFRGVYRDEYLDGEVVEDRLRVWQERLSTPAPNQFVVLAEQDDDPDWEALHDLHDFVEMVQAGFETLAKAAASR